MGQVSRELGRSGTGRFLIICFALVIAVIVAACEDPLQPTTARIAGRLTLEGQPMRPGFSVVFMEPHRGDLAFGVTDADGRFVVNSWKDGEMVPGRYKAHVVPPPLKGTEVSEETPENVVLGPYDFAEKYRHLDSTPLEFKVVVGENNFEIDLERKPDDGGGEAVETPGEAAGKP